MEKLNSQKQDDSFATYAPMITKKMVFLMFRKMPLILEHQIRAFYPWPGAFIDIEGEKMKILLRSNSFAMNGKPGERMILDGFPVIGTS